VRRRWSTGSRSLAGWTPRNDAPFALRSLPPPGGSSLPAGRSRPRRASSRLSSCTASAPESRGSSTRRPSASC
jgi:hypothetical protein